MLSSSMVARGGMSPKTLALKVGRHVAEIQRFVESDRVPTAALLHEIADALGWDDTQRAIALAAVAAFRRPGDAAAAGTDS